MLARQLLLNTFLQNDAPKETQKIDLRAQMDPRTRKPNEPEKGAKSILQTRFQSDLFRLEIEENQERQNRCA